MDLLDRGGSGGCARAVFAAAEGRRKWRWPRHPPYGPGTCVIRGLRAQEIMVFCRSNTARTFRTPQSLRLGRQARRFQLAEFSGHIARELAPFGTGLTQYAWAAECRVFDARAQTGLTPIPSLLSTGGAEDRQAYS